jgi:hypothetical protein
MIKKIFALIVLATIVSATAKSQDTVDTSFKVEPIEKKKKRDNTSNSSAYTPSTDKMNIEKHPSDHVLIQFGSDMWVNKPNSITTDGGRHFNIYFMNDKPFKTNPHFSVAYGLGLGTSNIYFDKMYVDIKQRNGVRFVPTTGANDSSWGKYKITSFYLEVPVELRYNFNHMNPSKSFKVAIGAKAGIFIKGYTKGKDLQKNGASLYNSGYIQKEVNGTFFNGTRLTLTGRIGYGNFTLHTAYMLTPYFISGSAYFISGSVPDLNTLSIGLCIGGL